MDAFGDRPRRRVLDMHERDDPVDRKRRESEGEACPCGFRRETLAAPRRGDAIADLGNPLSFDLLPDEAAVADEGAARAVLDRPERDAVVRRVANPSLDPAPRRRGVGHVGVEPPRLRIGEHREDVLDVVFAIRAEPEARGRRRDAYPAVIDSRTSSFHEYFRRLRPRAAFFWSA